VESAVEHGEQNSHLGAAPQAIREILNRIESKVGTAGAPVVAVTSSGARYFLRQVGESSLPNLFFLAHSEVPAGVKVLSLGVIQ
jgi:flagellar biosynthesis component FlhA